MSTCRIMKRLCMLSAGILFNALPSHARADEAFMPDDRTGYSYYSLQFGAPFPQARISNISNTAGPASSGIQSLEFDAGIIIDLIRGYYFNDRLHSEIKLSYSHGFSPTITNIAGFVENPNAGLTVPTTGSADTIGIFSNLRYDFAKFDSGTRLFAGVGAGIVRMTMNNLGPTASPFHINDSDTAYVVCLLAGFNYPVAHNLELTAQYTAVGVSSTKFTSVIGPNILTAISGPDLLHVGTIGFRYLFN